MSLGDVHMILMAFFLAQKQQSSFSKKELVEIVKGIGEKSSQSKVKQAWNEAHSVE